jgi:hypothetical protein
MAVLQSGHCGLLAYLVRRRLVGRNRAEALRSKSGDDSMAKMSILVIQQTIGFEIRCALAEPRVEQMPDLRHGAAKHSI